MFFSSNHRKSREEANGLKYILKGQKLQIIDEFARRFKNEGVEEGIRFLNEFLPEGNLPPIEKIKTNKNEEKAIYFKANGNEAFKKCEYRKAIEYYNKSIMMTPHANGTRNLSVLIANRSAALYHLEEYQSALNDIEVALTMDYPEELKYKIFERKAKCLLGLKRNEEAMTEFEKSIQALNESKIALEKKLKMNDEIQIQMKTNTDFSGMNEPKGESDGRGKECSPRLIGPRSKVYLSACNRIEIREDLTAGRYAVANADIAAGDTILIEKPYCSVLLPEFSSTNCQHCFKRSLTLYPCTNCTDVAFCSLKCQKSAKYHVYECRLLKNLYDLGVSVTVLMALRICTQHDVQFFRNLKYKLKSVRKPSKYESSDYLRVYQLVHHEDRRNVEDLFERSILALHFLRCLKKVGYFNENSAESEEDAVSNELSEDEQFLGTLLLRHLQILQFNAHEISELKIINQNLKKSKSMFIGAGLFPTLALFNHSCDPGIVRYFDGTRIIVRALKPIKKGEMIAENYGPIYSLMEKSERQEYLNVHYKFDCNCVPCQENWPTLKELNSNVIMLRFKCRPIKNKRQKNLPNPESCNNVLLVPTSNTAFVIKCHRCGQFTNLFPGLKALKETTEMTRHGLQQLEAGNHGEALKIFLKILTLLDEYMMPPFGDFLLIENYIRICMLAYGNKQFQTSIGHDEYLSL